MSDNPYQSPESDTKVEKRPAKPPNRYFYAAVCGVGTFGGLLFWQGMLATLVGLRLKNPLFEPSYTMLPYTILLLFLIPGTVGLVVASWAWRSPESVWPVVAAGLLWGSSLALWFIGNLSFFLP